MAKSQVGMSDEEYRAMLESVGVESSTQLTRNNFDKLMEHFKSLGFKRLSRASRPNGKKQSARRKKQKQKPPKSKEALKEKIGAILADLSLPWSYADKMAKKMFGVDALEWCDADQFWRIVAALSYHQKRQKAKAVNAESH